MIWNMIPADLRERAVPVRDLGHIGSCSAEYCWTRADALKVLDCIEGGRISIVGGDVLLCDGENVEYGIGFDWSCNSKLRDEYPEYKRRSWELARLSINATPAPAGRQLYFILSFYNEAGFNSYRAYRWPGHFDRLGITRVEPAASAMFARLGRWLRRILGPGK